jgi:hypothetical protein
MLPEIRQPNDRRSKLRFSIQRETRFKMLEDGVVTAAGTGYTINVGSGGVAFTAGHPLTLGAFVELSVSWPVLLDDTCPMRLIVFGRVLRSSTKKTVCSIDKYEYRTQARSFPSDGPPRSDSTLQRWAEAIRKEGLKASQAGV